jgi:hypothetical protein
MGRISIIDPFGEELIKDLDFQGQEVITIGSS